MPTNELPTNELPTNEMPKSGYVPVVSPTIPNTNPNNISYLSDLEFQIIMGLIRSNINNFDNKYDPKDVSKRFKHIYEERFRLDSTLFFKSFTGKTLNSLGGYWQQRKGRGLCPPD